MQLALNTFYSFEGGVHLHEEEVQEMVDEVVNYLLGADTGDYKFIATGDTVVVGHRYSDEIQIIVSQNYKEGTILIEKGGNLVPIDYRFSPEMTYNPLKEV